MTNTPSHNKLFSSKEEYLVFISAWKQLARAKQLTSEDCYMRCLLLGKPIERAFPPPTNPAKLANGHVAGSAVARAQLVALEQVKAHLERLHAMRERNRVSRHPVPSSWKHWCERWVGDAPDGKNGIIAIDTLQRAVLRAKELAQ